MSARRGGNLGTVSKFGYRETGRERATRQRWDSRVVLAKLKRTRHLLSTQRMHWWPGDVVASSSLKDGSESCLSPILSLSCRILRAGECGLRSWRVLNDEPEVGPYNRRYSYQGLFIVQESPGDPQLKQLQNSSAHIKARIQFTRYKYMIRYCITREKKVESAAAVTLPSLCIVRKDVLVSRRKQLAGVLEFVWVSIL